jgi:hypothetical protein
MDKNLQSQSTGSLTPGVTLIYERANGIVYARESGAEPSTRKEIGWDYDTRTSDGRPLRDHIQNSKLWGDIHRASKTNPALQEALDQVMVIYNLSKTDER